MVNLNLIIERIEIFKGVAGDKFVAEIVGLSPQDFSNRKKRGTLLPVIFEWASSETLDLNWLIKGEIAQPEVAADPAPIYINDMAPEQKKAASLKAKLGRILEEGNERAIKAIEAQLEAFDPGFKKQNGTHEDDGNGQDQNSMVA